MPPSLFKGAAPIRALVLGGRGAIGGGFLRTLQALGRTGAAEIEQVVTTSRDLAALETEISASSTPACPGIRAIQLDPTSEEDFARFAANLKSEGFRPNLVFNATGLLHSMEKGGKGAGGLPAIRPETTFKRITSDALLANFWANTLVNGLALRYVLGELADKQEEAAVFATLSAKVGSISDNKLGGWYSYRAAKASVNMLVACAAVECRRSHPGWRVVALHPGTVEGPLSAPFVGKAKAEKKVSSLQQYEELVATAEGDETPYVYWTPDVCAGRLFEVVNSRGPEDSGKLFDYAGKEILP